MKYYGALTALQIRTFAQAACDVLGHGYTNQSVNMLLRTCAAETGMGTIRDSNIPVVSD